MARGAQPLSIAVLFLTTLLTRLAAIGHYVTPDELNWVYRSLGFRRALLAGEWADTIRSGHPGITTTWVGAVSAQLQLWFQPELGVRLAWLDRLQQLSTDNVEAYRHLYAFLNGGRLAMAMLVSLGLVFVYLLACEQLGSTAALLGAFLLALDPFFAGLSGLLHVDGLLALFMLLALLQALHAQQGRPWAAVGAGVCSALALLTKTPGTILLALVPLLLIWPLVRRHKPGIEEWREGAFAGSRRLQQQLKQLLLWAGALAVTAMLLLPAIWSAPGYVLEVVGGLTGRLVVDAVRPTFFLGRSALDHGPLYYPLVLLFRLSPVALVGLVFAVAALARHRAGAASAGWLLLFALLFLLAITLAAKKFDRYALPSLVALTLIGGWGLARFESLKLRDRRRMWLTAVLLQAAFLLGAWPHPLTANNWLVGGRTVGRQVFPSGWGEDAGQAARALTSHLDEPEQATLFTSSLTGTAPFFPGEIIRAREANLTRLQPQHFLLALPRDDQAQWALPLAVEAPFKSVPVRGVGTAYLYSGLDAAAMQLPPFRPEPRQVRFGPAIRLTAAGAVNLPWPSESLVGLTWQRDTAASVSETYRLQLLLRDARGQVWVQREMLLLNSEDHAPPDWPAQAPQTVFYPVQLPATLAPGDYVWAARLFDNQGRQQPVFDPAGNFSGVQGEVAAMTVAPPAFQPSLEIPHPVSSAGPLVGYGTVPPVATAGAPITLDLWWRAQDNSPVTLMLEVGDQRRSTTLQTRGWRDDQVYRVRATWRLPVISAGRQPLALVVRDAADDSVVAGPYALGDLQIEDRQPDFSLPPGAASLQIEVGDLAMLQDLSLEVQEQQVLVHVVWQVRETTLTNYTTFVHLRDGERVLAAGDRPPSPPTSYWIPGEVIVETYALPRPQPGAYSVALGLYDADGGARLTMREADGQPLAADQALLPLDVP